MIWSKTMKWLTTSYYPAGYPANGVLLFGLVCMFFVGWMFAHTFGAR